MCIHIHMQRARVMALLPPSLSSFFAFAASEPLVSKTNSVVVLVCEFSLVSIRVHTYP